MNQSNVEAIVARIKGIPSGLQGDVSEAQMGLIMYLTRDAMIDCEWDDNPIVEMIWGDSRVAELSRADASRFIQFFGEKGGEGWEVKHVPEINALRYESLKRDGQMELWE